MRIKFHGQSAVAAPVPTYSLTSPGETLLAVAAYLPRDPSILPKWILSGEIRSLRSPFPPRLPHTPQHSQALAPAQDQVGEHQAGGGQYDQHYDHQRQAVPTDAGHGAERISDSGRDVSNNG